MTTPAFLLILTAAVLHALWNYVARTVSGDLSVCWLGLCTGCLLLLPAAVPVGISRGILQTTSIEGWACVGATGLLHALYFRVLCHAYSRGDLSVVYPVSRGSGVCLTALLAVVLLREPISTAGGAGIGLIVGGIVVMALAAVPETRDAAAVRLGLCVGCTIAGYSVVDKLGVERMHPLPYIWLMFGLSALFVFPFLPRRSGDVLTALLRRHRREILLIGAGSIGTYLLILFAFRMGRVSYVVAARELSVVFGAALAVTLLGERLTAGRVLATLLVVAGVILLKTG